jgi:tripartite-type tricarboxylate transporter receptor subunit TctC
MTDGWSRALIECLFFRPLMMIKISFFKSVPLGLCLVWGVFVAGTGHAQLNNYPNRPIKLVVPFVPGGTLDVVARLLGKNLSESFGQAVIVDNKAGAGGVVGVDYVAKSAPDGYTLVLNSATPMVTVVSLQKTPYDLLRDLYPVSQVSTFDYVLSVNAKSGIQNIQDLVQLAKKQPGKLNYASAGTGSGQHMYMELAKSVAGIQLQHIPYKGNGPAMQALLSGEVDLIFDTTLGILPQVQGAKLRPLMTSSSKPIAVLSGVPTIESLYPGSSIQGWHGVFAPSATPKEVLSFLSDAIKKAVNGHEMGTKLKELGLDPSGLGSEAFYETVKRDQERWGKVIRENNIKAD